MRAAVYATAERSGQTGSAKATCPATPSLKKVFGRSRVWSKNWSTTTMSPGRIRSFMLPTAEIDRIAPAPIFFIA